MQAFHVVLTTHNSRTSERMRKYSVKKGSSVYLNLRQELKVTTLIRDIILEMKYKCLAFNICRDHVHIILVCEYEELSSIVKVIKGKSSFLFNKSKLSHNLKKLWSARFFRADLDVWGLAHLSNKNGWLYEDSYLDNAIEYILNNRMKHELEVSDELEQIIKEFVITKDDAFKEIR